MRICFATNNNNKLEELRSCLGKQVELLSLADLNIVGDIPETGDTLEANSLEKAQFIYDKCNLPTIADDTGLEVDALNGRPGVYSARYAGEHCSPDDNMDKILSELNGISDRRSIFKTVITYLDGSSTHQFEGACEGVIREERSGAKGFGYDPIFEPEGFDVTFAEMSLKEKNKISHRGRAVAKFVEFFNQQ